MAFQETPHLPHSPRLPGAASAAPGGALSQCPEADRGGTGATLCGMWVKRRWSGVFWLISAEGNLREPPKTRVLSRQGNASSDNPSPTWGGCLSLEVHVGQNPRNHVGCYRPWVHAYTHTPQIHTCTEHPQEASAGPLRPPQTRVPVAKAPARLQFGSALRAGAMINHAEETLELEGPGRVLICPGNRLWILRTSAGGNKIEVRGERSITQGGRGARHRWGDRARSTRGENKKRI